MEKRKLTVADIDKVRHIEGFPIAKDEDIIALSDPPYYTACPNLFIEDFIREHGTPYDEATDDYHCEPFAADVSEGKNDPIYMAHSYHTKVPHKAIMRYILHYTKPGDIVFDGFCGTGMTGVAAQMCGNPDPVFKMQIENEMPGIEWGSRKAILSDLSPAATFIAYNYNTPVDIEEFRKEAGRIIYEVEAECGWMYNTQHVIKDKVQFGVDGKPLLGRINYTVWSDVYICPTCSKEFVFWDVAVDRMAYKVSDTFSCPGCKSELKKSDCDNAQRTYFDNELQSTVTMSKQVPVMVNYTYDDKRYEKSSDGYDIEIIDKIENLEIQGWFPVNRMREGRESRRNDRFGVTHVHQFYTKRNLIVLSVLFDKIMLAERLRIRKLLVFLFTSVFSRTHKQNRYMPNHNRHVGPLSGTLYIPTLQTEITVFDLLKEKSKVISSLNEIKETGIVSTQSAAQLNFMPDNTIDYIFTDPPFGSNLNYSELNFLWEVWLKVCTNNISEAIINPAHQKELFEYKNLMTSCFSEYYRVLKPGHWITIEFHNSKNAVWNTIQESLLHVGFIIADVRVLDKQKGTTKQLSTTSAVKQDLVISAYKPRDKFKREFKTKAGSEDSTWSFVQQHLENLPVSVVKNGKVEVLVERQAFLLFDRMVAYHIMNSIPVPIDAIDFYKGLDEHFLKRDNMYFLSDQVNEYDAARILNDLEDIQFSLQVTNEKNAIAWLYQQLGKEPQTRGELQPKFMQEIKTIDKHEIIPELSVLLEETFIQSDDGKWYIPDIKKEADVIKLREKKLIKEFDGYVETKGKLRNVRSEAIRAGFAKLWKENNYKLIIATAERLPESVIAEDSKLLMYVDLSSGRV